MKIKTFVFGLLLLFNCKSSLAYSNVNDFKNSDSSIEYNFSKKWIKNFGGSQIDQFESVKATSDSGFIVVGYSNSNDSEWTYISGKDAIISKFDNNGKCIWSSTFGGNKDDRFMDVIELKDGNFVAVGYSDSTNAGFTNKGKDDAIIVKYDKDGNQLWVNSYGDSFKEDDVYFSVTELNDGGIVAVGYTTMKDLWSEALAVKYNPNTGDMIGNSILSGGNSEYYHSVDKTSDGGFVVVGTSSSIGLGVIQNGYNDGIIAKYDSGLSKRWHKAIDFAMYNHESFNRVIVDDTGDFIILDNNFIARFSNSGNLKHKIRPEFRGVDIMQMSNGNFLICGNSYEHPYDAFIVICNSNFDFLWEQSIVGSNGDSFLSVTELSNGELITVGYSDSEDVGFANKGGVDAIMLKYGILTPIEKQLEKLEQTKEAQDLEIARELVNQLPESEEKNRLQEKLNNIALNISLELKNVTSNLDIYIKSENILQMTLDTNQISFDDFSGVEDMIKENAVNITINSSLPYQLNAYLPTEIQNSDKSITMDKDILNIKENSENTYQTFENTIDKVVLKDNCPAGNDLIHGIDIKLKSGLAFEKDIYKTTIKFEAQQK